MKKVKLMAIIAAVIAGVGVFFFLQEISKPKVAPHTEVVVALVDIPENTKITEDMVELKSVPDESLLENHMLDIESVVDFVSSGDIFAGEQITKNRLVRTGEVDENNNSLAYVIEDGMRAITIGVNKVTGIENMIRPGNRVDLIGSYEHILEAKLEDSAYDTDDGDGTETTQASAEASETNIYTKMFMQNRKILASGTEIIKDGANEYVTLTLEVTPEEAVIISCVENKSAIRVVLRSPLDDRIIEAPFTDFRTIMEEDKKQ